MRLISGFELRSSARVGGGWYAGRFFSPWWKKWEREKVKGIT